MLLPAFLLLVFAIAARSKIDETCTAFKSNGLASSTFLYHRFYDFRNISNSSVALTSNSEISRVVNDGSWKNDFYIRDYPRKSPGPPIIPVSFIPERVTLTNSTDNSPNYSTYLTLSSARIDEETQEGGEITFKEFNVTAASIRVSGRVKGTPGACAGVFTYLNDTQESDIEIFTKDPFYKIHYSNQPASTGAPDWTPIPGATVNVSMPENEKWTTWHTHRLDWIPGRSVFFVDGIEANSTTLHVPVARPPSGIYIDMWGANSTWVGTMPIGGEAWFDIQWIELLFNTTTEPTPNPLASKEQKICVPADDESFGVRSAGTVGSEILGIWLFAVTCLVGLL